jgi:hypothetical protein
MFKHDFCAILREWLIGGVVRLQISALTQASSVLMAGEIFAFPSNIAVRGDENAQLTK